SRAVPAAAEGVILALRLRAPLMGAVHPCAFPGPPLKHFPISLTLLTSLPGLTGQSSTHGPVFTGLPGQAGLMTVNWYQPSAATSLRARTGKQTWSILMAGSSGTS